jgi:hypothetical protein
MAKSYVYTDSFIILTTDSNGVEVIRDYSKFIPPGFIIENITIASEDIFYCKIPGIFESARETSLTDGSTTIPGTFFAVGGDFPPLTENLDIENYSEVKLHYMKTSSQAVNNRISVSMKYRTK